MLNSTEKKILYEIFKNKELSRTDISEKLSITSAAVSQYCASLIAQKYIIEIGEIDSKTHGRNRVLLSLNQEYGYVVGLAIEFDGFELAISDCSGQEKVSYQKKMEIEDMYVYFKEHLENIYRGMLRNADLYPASILGVGITSADILSKSNFKLSQSERDLFDRICQFVESLFQRMYNYKTVKANNVHALALTEYLRNEFEDNFFCIKYGPRIGVALWLHGNLFRGTHDAAGEISHLSLVETVNSNTVCKVCLKSNCLESIVSDQAIRNKIASIDNYEEELSFLFEKYELKELSAYEVFLNYNKSDKLEHIMNDVARALAKTIVTIEGIIDSNKIILFGKSFLISKFYNLVVDYVDQYSAHHFPIDIVLAKTNPDKKVDGAIYLILSNLFFI